jgi:hypothetical protein
MVKKAGILAVLSAVILLSGCELMVKHLYLATPTSISENDLSAHAATVYILSAAKKELVIGISGSIEGAGNVMIPAYVVIPEGETAATFNIMPIHNTGVTADVTVTFTASHPDYESGSDATIISNVD